MSDNETRMAALLRLIRGGLQAESDALQIISAFVDAERLCEVRQRLTQVRSQIDAIDRTLRPVAVPA